MKKANDFNTSYLPTWCPGCGNYGLWGAYKKVLAELDIPSKNIFASYGIGCSGNGFNFTDVNSFHGLHGRPLPVAEGMKFGNHKLTVLAFGGDGDGFGEGGNHFLHACRANHDITYFVHDNQIYSLTTGQTSPTSEKGRPSKSNPLGAIDRPVNPIALALTSGATFVARGFTGEINHLAEIMKAAIKHKGFSFVDILQPCFTFNKYNTHQYFRERVYKLQNNDTSDFNKAQKLAWQWKQDGRIPIGIFYQDESIPAFHEQLPQLKDKELSKQKLSIDLKHDFIEFV